MNISKDQIESCNKKYLKTHQTDFGYLSQKLSSNGIHVEDLLKKIGSFQVATPSWALGTGGTRFGRFPTGGEPGSLEDKIDDVGLLKTLSQQTASISLHIPWDIPKDSKGIKARAESLGLHFDVINSNTFQDRQDEQTHSYKFGSLCHTHKEVRDQAIEHNLEAIKYGKELGSNALTIWLADGSNFPGQQNFRTAFENVLDSLKQIYNQIPDHWTLMTEHKPYEPNFYSSVVNDWGSSLLLATKTGERCRCLVDLGHHLPNTNIEQVVSRLLMEGRLAGFHFNDSKYGDDDITAGSIKPYQLFLIFVELVEFLEGTQIKNPKLAWMIDASHNSKDPLEDLLQSLDAITLAYAQALLINRPALQEAQKSNDVTYAQEIMQDAYRTDVRPLMAQARKINGAALNPIQAFRELKVRETLIKERGLGGQATGL